MNKIENLQNVHSRAAAELDQVPDLQPVKCPRFASLLVDEASVGARVVPQVPTFAAVLLKFHVVRWLRTSELKDSVISVNQISYHLFYYTHI